MNLLLNLEVRLRYQHHLLLWKCKGVTEYFRSPGWPRNLITPTTLKLRMLLHRRRGHKKLMLAEEHTFGRRLPRLVWIPEETGIKIMRRDITLNRPQRWKLARWGKLAFAWGLSVIILLQKAKPKVWNSSPNIYRNTHTKSFALSGRLKMTEFIRSNHY